MRPRRLAVAALAGVLLPLHLGAQSVLRGRVLGDSTRLPLAGAEVTVPQLGLAATTDSAGTFSLSNIPRGRHLVVTRAVGYRPDSALFAIRESEEARDIILQRAAQPLGEVRVAAKSDPVVPAKLVEFYERRKRGTGYFVDREMLAKYENGRTSNVLATVPGMTVRYGTSLRAWATSHRGGRTFRPMDMSDRAAGAKADCYMDVYLDGTLVFNAAGPSDAPLWDVNSVPPSQIEAIEVYSASLAPAKYSRSSTMCGVILIWTRISK